MTHQHIVLNLDDEAKEATYTASGGGLNFQREMVAVPVEGDLLCVEGVFLRATDDKATLVVRRRLFDFAEHVTVHLVLGLHKPE